MEVLYRAIQVLSRWGVVFPDLFEATSLQIYHGSVGLMMKMWMVNLSKNLLPCNFQNIGL